MTGLWVNLINSKFGACFQSLRGNLTLLTTRIMSSAKEPVTFKLNYVNFHYFISVRTCYKKAKNTCKLW